MKFNKSRHSRFVIYVLFISVMWATSVRAQNDTSTANSDNPYKSDVNLKQYLKNKYPKLDDVVSSVHQTPDGPKGKLHLRGKITPKKAYSRDGDRNDRSRAIVKAFLEEEASLLGITKMDEMKEIEIRTSEGCDGNYTNVYYKRYINDLELEDAYLQFTIDSDDTIDYVGTNLVPVPQALYAASTKETLSAKQIADIVRQAVQSAQKIETINIKISGFKKLAITKAPYAIWKADVNLKRGVGAWRYTLDAVTGEILTRESSPRIDD